MHIEQGSQLFSLFAYGTLPSPPADNIDDPTGNFRGTPLTGWKVFLLLLCALLGIVVCAVVGAVVFQKRQERNKRFYWGGRGVLSLRCLWWNELFPDDRAHSMWISFLKIVQMFISFEALRWEWISPTRGVGGPVQNKWLLPEVTLIRVSLCLFMEASEWVYCHLRGLHSEFLYRCVLTCSLILQPLPAVLCSRWDPTKTVKVWIFILSNQFVTVLPAESVNKDGPRVSTSSHYLEVTPKHTRTEHRHLRMSFGARGCRVASRIGSRPYTGSANHESVWAVSHGISHHFFYNQITQIWHFCGNEHLEKPIVADF